MSGKSKHQSSSVKLIGSAKKDFEGKVYLLGGTWFPSWAPPVFGSWLGPESQLDPQGVPVLRTTVSLQAVWSSPTTSKVMFGSTVTEVPGGTAWTVFWEGSGVTWSGNMPSSKARASLMLGGLRGGSDAHRFLLMGILGGVSAFTLVWLLWP